MIAATPERSGHAGWPHKLAVLGPGLLGGSIALGWAQSHPQRWLRVWGRSAPRLEPVIKKLGVERVSTELADLVQADLVVLASPVGAMPGLVSELLDCGLGAGAGETLITDVGSVKKVVVEQINRVLSEQARDRQVRFVGSHPMAGSEKTGFTAARGDLFVGSTCIVMQSESLDAAECLAVERVAEFWQGLGARCVTMSPTGHDQGVARISHLPHVLASLGARLGLQENPGLIDLCAGGFRDTTRVASGAAAMWAEILMENREALRQPLEEAVVELNQVLNLLESEQQQELENWLAEAKTLRDKLPPGGLSWGAGD